MKLAAALVVIASSCASPAPARRPVPAASAAPSPSPGAPAHSYLVVTRQKRDAVRILPDTGAATDLPVGVTTLGASSDGATAALTAPDAGDVVLVSGWPAHVRTVTGLARPHEVAFTRSGALAVTEEGRDDVALVDVRTASVTKRIALPARPHAVTTDGDTLVVTMPDARRYAVVTLDGVVRTVRVGERPHVCVPAQDAVWCVTYDAPHVLRFVHDAVSTRVSVGVYPHHLRGEPDGGVLVSDPNGGRVYRLDAAGKVVHTFAVSHPEQALLDGGATWVASDDGFIEDLETGTRTTVGGTPHALARVAG